MRSVFAPMRLFTAGLVTLMLLTAASAQCCIGAFHVGSSTTSGDFRVEARSIGKLHGHGPYHFRFEILERSVQGKWVARGTFEKKFATRAHFGMEVVPSETGNGVYVRGPGEKDLHLYDRQGRLLARIPSDRPGGVSLLDFKIRWPNGQDEMRCVYPDGGIARHLMPNPVKEFDENGVIPGPPIGRLYLPLGLDLTPPTGRRSDDERLAWLARMLHWTPEQGERQAQEVRKHLLALRSEDHEDAARALVTLGLSSLPAVDAALKAGDASERLRKVRARIWTMLCGHRAPQDNLTLLAGILRTGDSRLVLHARSRLRSILPKETPIDGKWIFEHRRELAKAITARRAKAERTNGNSPGSKKKRNKESSEYRDHFAEDGGIGATSGLINPHAWHHDGKTYLVYQGYMNAPTFTFYDHRKPKGERWAPVVKAGVNPLGNRDTHGAPSMLIDKQGYIHVFYGSHGRRQMYSRSKRPYDITEWNKMPPVSPQMTYPCGAMLENGTMVLIGRAGGHVRPWVEVTSSDSGDTWSTSRPIVDFRPHALYGTVKPGVDGKTVHFTWSLQAKGDLLKGTSTERFSTGRGKYGYGNTVIDNRHHCFYMRRDQKGRWYNIQGEPLQTPIDRKTAYQKCLVYRGDWPLHGQHGTMGIDKEDKPHIVFLGGKMPADKARWHTNNVDYVYKYARWDSKHWVLSDITTTDSIWDMGQAVFPEPDGSVDVYLVARGSVTDNASRTTKGRIGGNIEQWRSKDHGKTWKKIKDVITHTKTGRLFNCPHAVVNAHPDGKVMFSTWSSDEYFQQGDFTQFVYLYGDSGFCSRRY